MTGLPVVGQQQLRAAIPSGKSIFDYIQYAYALYNTKEVVKIPYKWDEKTNFANLPALERVKFMLIIQYLNSI